GKRALSGATGQRSGNSANDAKASSSDRNQSMPAWPVCSASSHSKIDSASRSACAEISTRNVMLATYIGEELVGGSSVSGFHVIIPLLGYLERLPQSPGFPIPSRRPKPHRGLRLESFLADARILPIPPDVRVLGVSFS